ncbi:Putative peptidoglycan binding domain protein [Paraliobacillus sp. PM-2]|uniref:peptidoglycan-binding domain-containing protein n=1 Tax=Paraliobacillus sp. PM-2 TaxID=1462524 RepID=UPI00061C5177|nr:peptidoglycan-binding domain-containing protein [Paraliobacillus sp. PM-2]CQR46046.1 Putative peptidoglycan binding domain protein [Paraliobacillus sp. PM-2]
MRKIKKNLAICLSLLFFSTTPMIALANQNEAAINPEEPIAYEEIQNEEEIAPKGYLKWIVRFIVSVGGKEAASYAVDTFSEAYQKLKDSKWWNGFTRDRPVIHTVKVMGDEFNPADVSNYVGYNYTNKYKRVNTLQRALNDYYGYTRLVTDGAFGPNTASVLRAYQTKEDLLVDSIAGPGTWRHLSK